MELTKHLCLAREAFPKASVVGKAAAEHFNRDVGPTMQIHRLIDLGLSAFSD
jgi:hypothetical protein